MPSCLPADLCCNRTLICWYMCNTTWLVQRLSVSVVPSSQWRPLIVVLFLVGARLWWGDAMPVTHHHFLLFSDYQVGSCWCVASTPCVVYGHLVLLARCPCVVYAVCASLDILQFWLLAVLCVITVWCQSDAFVARFCRYYCFSSFWYHPRSGVVLRSVRLFMSPGHSRCGLRHITLMWYIFKVRKWSALEWKAFSSSFF